MIQPTIDKLRVMKLTGLAESLLAQLQSPDTHDLSFEERISLLVDNEWTYRQNRRLARLIREAKLRMTACPEDVDYRHPRGLDRAVLRSLFTCQWIGDHQNVLITGPTGCGKTYLACALAQAACRQGYTARYYRLSRLVSELLLTKADGSYPRFLAHLARVDLLVLDDWGLAPLSASDSRELLEVIDDRSQVRSSVIASQLPLEHWHSSMADPTVADATLDRLIHNAHKIELNGDTMRKKTLPTKTPDGKTKERTDE